MRRASPMSPSSFFILEMPKRTATRSRKRSPRSRRCHYDAPDDAFLAAVHAHARARTQSPSKERLLHVFQDGLDQTHAVASIRKRATAARARNFRRSEDRHRPRGTSTRASRTTSPPLRRVRERAARGCPGRDRSIRCKETRFGGPDGVIRHGAGLVTWAARTSRTAPRNTTSRAAPSIGP